MTSDEYTQPSRGLVGNGATIRNLIYLHRVGSDQPDLELHDRQRTCSRHSSFHRREARVLSSLPKQLWGAAWQVIGRSTITDKFELRDGNPLIVRLPAIRFVDDGPANP